MIEVKKHSQRGNNHTFTFHVTRPGNNFTPQSSDENQLKQSLTTSTNVSDQATTTCSKVQMKLLDPPDDQILEIIVIISPNDGQTVEQLKPFIIHRIGQWATKVGTIS